MKRWQAEFTHTFLKKERKIPTDIKRRIIRAVSQILENPYRGTPLVGNLKGLWREDR